MSPTPETRAGRRKTRKCAFKGAHHLAELAHAAKLVIAGGDATELLDLVEEAFDMVALAIESFGAAEALLAPDHIGNVGGSRARLDLDTGSPTVVIVRFVSDDGGVLAEIGQKRFGAASRSGPSKKVLHCV